MNRENDLIRDGFCMMKTYIYNNSSLQWGEESWAIKVWLQMLIINFADNSRATVLDSSQIFESVALLE